MSFIAHQVLTTAAPGDAVTDSALKMADVLREFGSSLIFAENIHPDLYGRVFPLRDYDERAGNSEMIVWHSSIGAPEVREFLQLRDERIVLVYHNITPPHFFDFWDTDLAALLRMGLQDLELLRSKVHLSIAVSDFNARELNSIGYRNVEVVPLTWSWQRLGSIAPHQPTVDYLANEIDGPVLLYVGQVSPHKRLDLLLKAYHILTTYLRDHVHLFMIGSHRVKSYSETVRSFVKELNLPFAQFPGALSDAELAAHFERADVIVTMSEHEGLCLPLVEAMAFDTPFLARSHAAVPFTAGGAGVLLPPEEDPFLAAEAMELLISDADLCATLKEKGKARLAALDPEGSMAKFRDVIRKVA